MHYAAFIADYKHTIIVTAITIVRDLEVFVYGMTEILISFVSTKIH